MQEKSYFLISGIVATSLYIAICIATLFYIHSPKAKKFDSFNKTTVLELELISSKSNERKVARKRPKKVEEIVKKSTSRAAKQRSVDAKSLFANVKTKAKKVTEKTTKTTKESLDPSRFKSKFQKQKKSDNTSDVSKLLTSDKTTSTLPKNFSAKGETHEYFSKIKEILWQRWNPKLLEQGLKVKVLVMITNSGVFDYRIVKYSRDERFDQSLKEFLESQKNEIFPTHNINAKVDIIINFKSEG